MSLSWCIDHWFRLQLDGYIARNWPNQKSALGSALDPLADKILISVLYVSLTYAQLIPSEMNGSYKNYISAIIYWPADPDLKGQFTQKWQIAVNFVHSQAIQDVGDFFFSRTVRNIFSWNCGPWWFIKCKSRVWESNKAYQATQNEYPWLLAIYWGLMKRNDQSVQETDHFLQHYYL